MATREPTLPVIEQLRDAVRGCGLSLSELGRRSGVSQGQLSRFLSGERTLTLPAAAKLCLFLGLQLGRAPAADSGSRPRGRAERTDRPRSQPTKAV